MPPPAKRNYALAATQGVREFPAPRLPYQPPSPKRYRPKIGLIGCGGITKNHLEAYRTAGWEVVALCARREAAARLRQQEYYPGAALYTDYRKLLERDDVDVVDIALHPEPRLAMIESALMAGKHVLSQKPFVNDLDDGERLVALAGQLGRKLAVNHNGRWAPYVRYAALAVQRGLIGEVQNVAIRLNWDHTWIRGTPFESMPHVVLHDFGIHWFDMAALFFEGRTARSVSAATAFAPGQQLQPPMLASATVAFEGGTATLNFDAHSRFGPGESLCITGTGGTFRACGPVCAAHDITLFTKRGCARPELQGQWFNDGFRGTMGELLCAIAEDREPSNSARSNLQSLALCFAAAKAADTATVQTPGKVRRLPG